MATPLAQLGSTVQPEGLSARYTRIRSTTTLLAEPLAVEDQVVQAIPEASPAKWHLAHTTWFFERFCLMEHARGYEPFDPQYHYLFNSYYYTTGEMHGRSVRGQLSRPTVADIQAYRAHIDDAMLRLIESRDGARNFESLVLLGLNHEQQHQELLLTDIKQAFFLNPLGPAYRDRQKLAMDKATPLKFVSRRGGETAIGASGDSFCFDNETPRHVTLLRTHSLANRLVTNGEYREFIDDGGYSDPALWLADGWTKLRELGWNRPLCWSENNAREFTLGGWRPLDPNAPVCHVSYYEADAFARWAGARLPTEAEWETAAADTPVVGNLLDEGFMHPAGASGTRGSAAFESPGAPPAITQLWGDVWEWCSSSYAPYPGFEPLAGSLGEYNGKFMCNQLVVRGGSCVTWAEHVRPSYRSFFYPHDRWQFLGFRLAKNS
jgi:ergothioneine biosynthesis protein EgtB